MFYFLSSSLRSSVLHSLSILTNRVKGLLPLSTSGADKVLSLPFRESHFSYKSLQLSINLLKILIIFSQWSQKDKVLVEDEVTLLPCVFWTLGDGCYDKTSILLDGILLVISFANGLMKKLNPICYFAASRLIWNKKILANETCKNFLFVEEL